MALMPAPALTYLKRRGPDLAGGGGNPGQADRTAEGIVARNGRNQPDGCAQAQSESEVVDGEGEGLFSVMQDSYFIR